MALDPSTIELTAHQKNCLAAIAERTGKDCATVVDELLSAAEVPHAESLNGTGPHNLLEALEAVGAIGCFEGPPDLSTNPKYLEGFGAHASRRDSH